MHGAAAAASGCRRRRNAAVRRHHCDGAAAVRCCGDGKQQNVFSNRITHFGGAASKNTVGSIK